MPKAALKLTKRRLDELREEIQADRQVDVSPPQPLPPIPPRQGLVSQHLRPPEPGQGSTARRRRSPVILLRTIRMRIEMSPLEESSVWQGTLSLMVLRADLP